MNPLSRRYNHLNKMVFGHLLLACCILIVFGRRVGGGKTNSKTHIKVLTHHLSSMMLMFCIAHITHHSSLITHQSLLISHLTSQHISGEGGFWIERIICSRKLTQASHENQLWDLYLCFKIFYHFSGYQATVAQYPLLYDSV